MTTKTRIKQLEKASGKGEKKKYFCLVNSFDSPYSPEGGRYKAQAMDGGEDLYFDTLAELEAFEKRPDIDMTIIRVVYASEAIAEEAEAMR